MLRRRPSLSPTPPLGQDSKAAAPVLDHQSSSSSSSNDSAAAMPTDDPAPGGSVLTPTQQLVRSDSTGLGFVAGEEFGVHPGGDDDSNELIQVRWLGSWRTTRVGETVSWTQAR